MSTKINGKDVSTEEAKKTLSDPQVVVTEFSLELGNDTKSESPLTNDGFALDKDFIAGMSQQMDRLNAGLMKFSALNSRKIMGKDFYVLMIQPDYLPWWKKRLLRLLNKIL